MHSSAAAEKDRKRKRKAAKPVVDADALKHGGWYENIFFLPINAHILFVYFRWTIADFEQILGPVAIEVFPYTYVKALDDGTFAFGSPHNEGRRNIEI